MLKIIMIATLLILTQCSRYDAKRECEFSLTSHGFKRTCERHQEKRITN